MGNSLPMQPTSGDLIQFSQSISGGITSTALEQWSGSFEDLCEYLSSPQIVNSKFDADYYVRAIGDYRNDKSLSNHASLLILDGDSHIDENGEVISGSPSLQLIHEALARHHVQHIIHTTYSHTLEVNKCRVIIPCEYSREQLLALVDSFIALLHSEGVMLAPVKENYAWAQPWFRPSADKSGGQ